MSAWLPSVWKYRGTMVIYGPHGTSKHITSIPKDTKIEDIKEFFQIEVMTSSPNPNFVSNGRYSLRVQGLKIFNLEVFSIRIDNSSILIFFSILLLKKSSIFSIIILKTFSIIIEKSILIEKNLGHFFK